MESIQKNIEHSLSRRKRGDIVFVSDFKGVGSEAAIRQSLSRLVKSGKIKRLSHGVYYKPKIHPILGELRPGAEQMAEKIAKKEKVNISTTGVAALNQLGLSTQVPMNLVYLTDGVRRLLTIGKMKIKFKPTTPKKLAFKGAISRLVILALDELDMNNMDPDHEKKILGFLQMEDPRLLQHDLILATGRVHDYIVKLLKRHDHDDRLVKAGG